MSDELASVNSCRLVQATANHPGAIAILQLIGEVLPVMCKLTSVSNWPLHRLRLVDFGGIDQGLAGRITDDVAQLMPHGGPRVIQRLTAKLIELGATFDPDSADSSIDPQLLYPEAEDRYEALMVVALARAQSPLATDLLLDQPRRWRQHFPSPSGPAPLVRGGRGQGLSEEDLARSRRLNRLIDPPIVVLAGRPNVGKSTLSNALFGRSMSIALDLSGTTRDYTAGRIDLAGLVVNWHDTPGMRVTNDPVESKAVEIARRLIEHADFLIAMRDSETDWPVLTREPDLCVLNKVDLLHGGEATLQPSPPWGRGEGEGVKSSHAKAQTLTPALSLQREREPVRISALTGEGVPALVTAVRDRLIHPADLSHPGLWMFDERLLRLSQASPRRP